MTPQEAFDLMTEKGLTFAEKRQIQNCFIEQGRQTNPNVEFDTKFQTWSNKRLPKYEFATEQEAVFIGELKKLAPNVTNEQIKQVFKITTKLLDVESGWKF